MKLRAASSRDERERRGEKNEVGVSGAKVESPRRASPRAEIAQDGGREWPRLAAAGRKRKRDRGNERGRARVNWIRDVVARGAPRVFRVLKRGVCWLVVLLLS